MIIAQIVGTVVSTRKDEKLEGLKFYVARELNAQCKPTGREVIAVDIVGVRVLGPTGVELAGGLERGEGAVGQQALQLHLGGDALFVGEFGPELATDGRKRAKGEVRFDLGDVE